MTTNKITAIPGGITATPGFMAAGINAGLKKDQLDLAMIYNPVLCSAAAVFTTNKVKAAPLLVSRDHLVQANGYAHGVVINSGNANACNGVSGVINAQTMVAVAAQAMGIKEEYMLVSSTGVIGQPLPMDKVLPGIVKVAGKLKGDGGREAAQAIITTDLTVKEKAVQLELGGKIVTIGGMAKGSGMIHPNMATMLAYITTDISIAPKLLHSGLKEAVENTFNMITVDGDTSTNDTVVVLASGEAGCPPVVEGSAAYADFVAALTQVCTTLAQAVARDGEGATTLLAVVVKNAATITDARLAAKAVAGSNLFKAAVFGRDANWGRILCAVGYSGAQFQPEQVDIYIGEEQVARDGGGIDFSEERAAEILKQDQVTVTVDLKVGDCAATAWGCDLTYDYVRINGSYRT
ncbi:MAG: bifunctional glutamate N-acetyltransferase/amino-acid acetyltransferase ArgJ [Desulfotomaculum sp.]|nr:bifunctional glutamate N-acetyltransferase/amino-acid acetyltransferase ArgJ [Desulfotomaculum sp.]MCL0080690.1 bifunctional glutamate N-acetyltransferase/amino-acid acetyltransferase ArgJ [Peptococcaceae bacterium]